MRKNYCDLLVLIVNVYLLQIEYDFDLLYPGKDPMILFIKFELFKKKLLVYLQKSNYKGIDKLVVNEILDPSVPGKFITKLICNRPIMIL